MDSFLGIGGHLIKVEVEESLYFDCIICKAAFFSRTDRNTHLETHFVHRSCEQCNKAIILIGDLEFELHRPSHCKTKISSNIKYDKESFDETVVSLAEDDIKTEDEATTVSNSQRKTKRSCAKVNYNEDILSESAANNNKRKANFKEKSPPSSNKKRSPSVKSPKKLKKEKTETIEIGTNVGSNTDDSDGQTKLSGKMSFCNPNDDFVVPKSQSESEDDMIKEMESTLSKRKKNYARLAKRIPCTMCDDRFGAERTLKIHMSQVHGIKEKYICPICSRELKNTGNLKQHIETHSDYKRFICNYCGKGFHLPFNLKEHMNLHTGARPYKCETCGKTFGRSTLKQAHMRIHTGEKPYKCTEENCDRAYAYQTDLKRHRRSVHGIITKTFPCPICSKVFYENKFLTKHLNVHQGNV